MNDTLTLAVIISGMALLVLIGVIIYVCTYHSGIYKSFRNPVKTTGVIVEARYIDVPDDGENFYLITYSFTDSAGVRHSATFKWLRNIGRDGDKITVHYDSQNPEKSIADCQLKYGKSLWWKVPVILAVLIVPAIFIAFYFGK